MKRALQALIWVLFAVPAAPGTGRGAEPSKAEAPAGGPVHAPRGSVQEQLLFEEHSLLSEKALKNAGRARAGARKAVKAPAGGEVSDSLSKDERPALRLLKAKQGAKAPQSQSSPEAPQPGGSGVFTADYELEGDGEVSVDIVGADGAPVQHYVIPAGQEGGRKGRNSFVWDGTDKAGNEAPAGDYFVFQSVRYEFRDSAGGKKQETRTIPLRKRAK